MTDALFNHSWPIVNATKTSYTDDDDPSVLTSTSNSPSPSEPSGASQTHARKTLQTPIIVGSVLGGVVFLLLLGGILYFFHRRSKRNKVAFDRERMVRNQRTASMVAFVSFDRGGNSAQDNSRLQPVRPPSLPEIAPPVSRISKPFRIKPREQPSTTNLPTQHIYQRNHAVNPIMQLINVHSSPPMSSPTASLRYSSYMGLQPHRMILTPLTDRQLEVQSLIHQLQARMIRLQASANDPDDDKNTVEEIEEEVTITRLKADVEKLKNVRESEWARGVSDEVPREWEELRNCMQRRPNRTS